MSLTARELDYVAVMKSYRGNGVSHEIIAKLLSNFQSRPIFATTSNDAMKNTLSRAGFVQQGTEWQGTNGQLSLWIKS